MSVLQSRIDLFGLARLLALDFVLPAISRSALYGLISTIVFFNAGVVVYYFGVTRLFAFDSSIATVLTLGFTLTTYTLLGLLLGLTIGGASALHRKLADAEPRLVQILQPLTELFISRLPVGQHGIDLENFNQILNGGFAEIQTGALPPSRLRAVSGLVIRCVLKIVLRISRTVFISDFVQDMRARGETRVTSQSVERFARERFVRLFIGHAQRQVNVTRRLALAVAVVFLLIPIVVVGFRTTASV